MEPPANRSRTGPSPLGQQQNDEDDELNYEPEEVSQMRDPGYQLDQSRAFAAFKLKSTFEHIFQKYERDFTGIGDEIDLRTGKIITNNGHLKRMRNERDTGIPDEEDEDEEGVLLEDAYGSDEDDEPSDADQEEDGNAGQSDEDDEERILHGKKDGSSTSTALVRASEERQRRLSSSHALPVASITGPEGRLSSLVPGRPGSGHSNLSINVWGSEPGPVDPTWSAPEIHKPNPGDNLMSKLYGARYRFPVTRGSESVWSSRPDSEQEKMAPEPAQIDLTMLARARLESSRMARPTSMKLLQAFAAEDDNEDDILGLSIADRTPRAKGKLSSAENEQSQTEAPCPGSVGKVSQSNTETQNSLKKRSETKSQLVGAKIRNTKKVTEAEDAQDEIENGASGDTQVEDDSVPCVSFLVTEMEAQERPKQRLVIELFSRAPPPGEVTEVEDPEDIDTFATEERNFQMLDADIIISEDIPNSKEPPSTREATLLNGESTSDKPDIAQEQPKKPPEAPKETFTRHEIDPSYAFSDDEGGIPNARARAPRRERLAMAVVATHTAQAAPEASNETLKKPLASGDPHQIEENLRLAIATSIVDDALKGLGEMEIDSCQELQADVPMETIEVPLSRSISHEASVEGTSTLEKQASEESSEDQESVATPEPAHGALNDAASTPSPPSVTQPPRSEGRDDNEENQGFFIPLGLDEVEAASATELEPEPEARTEAMDVELSSLPVPAETEAEVDLPTCPKRGRPPTKGPRKAQREVISPMRRLNLDSSSPLKRRANDSLKPRTSVRFNEATQDTTETSSQILPGTGLPPPSIAQDSPHPATPSSKPRAAKTPSSRRSFVSLLSDDEDELTLDLFKSWTNGSGGSSGGRKKTPYAPVLLAGPQTKITTPMKQRTHNAGSGGSGMETVTSRGKKRKAAWAFAATPTRVQFGSPSHSMVRTPGGHMRRCGDEGFKCDRDFCFTCL